MLDQLPHHLSDQPATVSTSPADRPGHLPARSMFVAWAQPNRAARSSVLARELGIANLRFVHGTSRRGWLAAPRKYPAQFIRTFWMLIRDRPRIVFVQSPPSFAAWTVALYCLLSGASFVIDAHSDAFQRAIWTRPRWLNRIVARRALATIVTDEHWRDRVGSWGAHSVVVRDIPTDFPRESSYPVTGSFSVAVVNSWARDEPLTEVLAAASELPDIQFHVTGRADGRIGRLGQVPPNVHFTDFLPDPAYHGLLGSASAVVCLTTRDHTMQRGACEALSLGRPIVTSDWPLLRSYFTQGTVHVDNTAAGIRDGLRRLIGAYDTYLQDIQRLRDLRRREWAERKEAIVRLVGEAVPVRRRSRRSRAH